jgi:periplasmic copper chaperone A
MNLLVLAVILVASIAPQKNLTATKAWVKAPATGETTATAFVVVDNPTMYDVYLVSVTTDAAGKVQFQKPVEAKSDVVEFVIAPAYGSVELKPDGVQMRLIDLKRTLNPGDTVTLTLTTDNGLEIEVSAEVRKN